MKDKSEIRRELKEKLRAFSPKERSEASAAIAARLFSSAEYRDSTSIFIYHALPEEADTRTIIGQALADGKKVYLPRIEGADMALVPYHGEPLSPNEYGILEPTGAGARPDLDLAVIPLLGFDRRLGRLGRGKGFYDRFLAHYRGRCVALAFSLQEVSEVPTEGHDAKPQAIFTEKERIE